MGRRNARSGAVGVMPPEFKLQLFAQSPSGSIIFALVGIYGVMSFTMSQRTHEIGVRVED